MADRYFLTMFLSLLFSVVSCEVKIDFKSNALDRKTYPSGFLFGTGSSSYQYEGAVNEGGRTPSIWDTFTHNYPEKIVDGSNGDIGTDFYHRYKEDVAAVKELGFDSFRISLSWSRILPSGKLSGGVNREGIQFYQDLISEIVLNGMEPFVTLLHFDVPQALEDQYNGFLDPQIIRDFEDYADICFREFGDRVKYWMTINEPSMFAYLGYDLGKFAPGRCSKWMTGSNCSAGDSATEPYIVTHHMLLAHSAAFHLYKNKYQVSQKGKIGISLLIIWMVPLSQTPADQNAASRAIDFTFGWCMHPLTFGDYPPIMKSTVGNRLQKFSKEESVMIKGSMDFLGLNYYTGRYATNASYSGNVQPSYTTDRHVNITTERNGVPIGPTYDSEIVYIYPRGLYEALIHTWRKYNNPVIYITENGIGEKSENQPIKKALKDDYRVSYHHLHLSSIKSAIREGVDVKGYFAWSYLDNFELSNGYSIRFGITFVDRKNGLKRYPKQSAKWFKSLSSKGNSTE